MTNTATDASTAVLDPDPLTRQAELQAGDAEDHRDVIEEQFGTAVKQSFWSGKRSG